MFIICRIKINLSYLILSFMYRYSLINSNWQCSFAYSHWVNVLLWWQTFEILTCKFIKMFKRTTKGIFQLNVYSNSSVVLEKQIIKTFFSHDKLYPAVIAILELSNPPNTVSDALNQSCRVWIQSSLQFLNLLSNFPQSRMLPIVLRCWQSWIFVQQKIKLSSGSYKENSITHLVCKKRILKFL